MRIQVFVLLLISTIGNKNTNKGKNMMNKLISFVVGIWTDVVVIISPIMCGGFYGASPVITEVYTKPSVFTDNCIMGTYVPLSFEKTKGVITNEA